MLWRFPWTSRRCARIRALPRLHSSSLAGLPLPSPAPASAPARPSIRRAHTTSSRENRRRIRRFPGINKPLLTPDVVRSTLSSCPSDLIALRFFLWCAEQPDYFHDRGSFDRMASVVARLGDRYGTVSRVVGELESIGCAIKPRTFLLLLRIYWHGGLYESVLETFEEMGRFGFAPNTFARNILMDVLFKIGRVDVALEVLKQTQVPNFLSFNIALCNLCKVDDLGKIRDVVRSMLKNGFYPNVATLEMVLNAFVKKCRLVEATQVLTLMITGGAAVSVNAWSMLINGFCRLQRFDMAVHLLEKMGESGCTPNVVTYTTLIKGFMESEMVNCALKILSVMDLSERNLVPDSYTICSLLTTLCRLRKFSLMRKIVIGLDIEADLVLYNSLLSYYCKAGKPSLAVDLYDHMIDSGFTPDKYSFVGLLTGLCGAKRIGEAINVYNGIIRRGSDLDAHVHTTIINGLIKAGKCHQAIRFFRKAMEEKYEVDVVSYTVAIRGLFRGGRGHEVTALYDEMKGVGISPNTQVYNMMVSGFCKDKDAKMVTQILREMVDGRIVLSCNSYSRICSFLSRSSSSHLAFGLLIEMQDLGLFPAEEIVLCGHRLAQDACLGGDGHSPVPSSLSESNLSLDASCSEDMSDMAVSVG
ncbi:hypothetical protein EUGRSUZ_F04004 [Eucalyptus grandis]|uniref:Uncharacterized protein n=2 Tax=Eucalyptus grandis TaxID=71139 RepID=A0ACC3KP83_EUCGR|nr:hypothetical protein EUGRSUZ_F04004 [Eucalyptus grandis]